MQEKRKKTVGPASRRFAVVRALSLCFFVILLVAVIEVNFNPSGADGLALQGATATSPAPVGLAGSAGAGEDDAYISVAARIEDTLALLSSLGAPDVAPAGQTPEEEAVFMASLKKGKEQLELPGPQVTSQQDDSGAAVRPARKWNLFSYSPEELLASGVSLPGSSS